MCKSSSAFLHLFIYKHTFLLLWYPLCNLNGLSVIPQVRMCSCQILIKKKKKKKWFIWNRASLAAWADKFKHEMWSYLLERKKNSKKKTKYIGSWQHFSLSVTFLSLFICTQKTSVVLITHVLFPSPRCGRAAASVALWWIARVISA